MCKFHRTIIEPAFTFLTLGSMAWAQHSGVMPADLVNRVSQMYQDDKQYSFEGDLEIARRGGTENPRELLLKAKVKMAVAPAGKYNLQVEMNNNSSYVVVSDGQKSWTYVPSLKRYTEKEALVSMATDGPEAGLDVQSKGMDLAAEFSRLVVPILSGLAKSADVIDLKGSLLMVLAKKDEKGRQNMTYLTIDPVTLDIKRMSWMNATPSENGDKVLVRSDLSFETFRMGGPISDADFTFHPPKEAKRVDSLPRIFGQGRVSR